MQNIDDLVYVQHCLALLLNTKIPITPIQAEQRLTAYIQKVRNEVREQTLRELKNG